MSGVSFFDEWAEQSIVAMYSCCWLYEYSNFIKIDPDSLAVATGIHALDSFVSTQRILLRPFRVVQYLQTNSNYWIVVQTYSKQTSYMKLRWSVVFYILLQYYDLKWLVIE